MFTGCGGRSPASSRSRDARKRRSGHSRSPSPRHRRRSRSSSRYGMKAKLIHLKCEQQFFFHKGPTVARNARGVEAGLAAALPVAGGQEGQRRGVANDLGREVALDLANEGEGLVPAAGPGSILVQNFILTPDACVWDSLTACNAILSCQFSGLVPGIDGEATGLVPVLVPETAIVDLW